MSSFDTDYILVQSTQLERAKIALLESGYCVKHSQPEKAFKRALDDAAWLLSGNRKE